MEKEGEENQTEEQKDAVVEKVTTVSLAQIPTDYGTVFRTPEGDMGQMEYLVWLGNMFIDFKAAIAGN